MHIDSYSFGHITVDGVQYTSDLILLPDRVAPDWWRKEGHLLCPEDLEVVVEAKPEVLIVGIGANGIMRVPESTATYLAEQGIELVVEKSKRACETFNALPRERRAAAALHLTY